MGGDMSEQAKEEIKPGSWGKRLAALGVSMIALSIILGLAGVSGALFHNIMQLGGIAIAVVGVVMWKVLKK